MCVCVCVCACTAHACIAHARIARACTAHACTTSAAAARCPLAGAKATLSFVLTWSFPNRTKAYSHITAEWDKILPNEVLGNRYSTWFADAKATVDHVASHRAYLGDTTALYTDTIYGSSLPWGLIDSAAGRAAV